MSEDLRFGVALGAATSRSAWVERCRYAETLGFDVIGVPDHLGMLAPFPAMMLAAEATERVRLNTFVLNAPFYSPALLAREAATVDLLTDGRVELGLGAGYAAAEFERAGIPFPSARDRVDRVGATAAALRAAFDDAQHTPRPARPGGPPLFIAGWGDRLLRVAARHADIVGLTGARTDDAGRLRLTTEADAAGRVALLNDLWGERAGTVEINTVIQALLPSGRGRPERLTARVVWDEEAPEDYISVLVGTPRDMADRLLELRARYGVGYFTVLDHNLEAMAPVIALLRG
ncbi:MULTISPECIES: TIGR03621 family F420-dependent LLM class oxidoreductase [Tsukamurella]|uniref:TIGR03621 family F420-dependent LLM class oxidoreductase n=2 Tax=Tsukamurella TaxID=2060 RepID=A0A5C5S016_9ACTN|nr:MULTISPECIES: TIGR03621 family F420-dependent LLM class oxidoreductase [Tsukamurella]NMD54532.1 TIGR03621 family F420-dependent LLM class oxidoreductase [Tsukamurella columbiensis]TWS28454.1 TIGR03621 family F420-dependent LLM class oxidoreductase [Tsukamurella conjunctivitidis]